MPGPGVVPDVIVVGGGVTGASPEPIVRGASLVDGVALVRVALNPVSGPTPIASVRLYRAESLDGPWFKIDERAPANHAAFLWMFDWDPPYGHDTYYAATVLDTAEVESNRSQPVRLAGRRDSGTQTNVPTIALPTADDHGFEEPAAILLDRFPQAPFSFASGGPIGAIIRECGQAVLDFRSRVLQRRQQASMQTATGGALDAHARIYGIAQRLPKEMGAYGDDFLRARLQAATQASTGRLADIQAAIIAYYASALPDGVPQPVVTVYDLKSDPVTAATDGLVIMQFVIWVTFQYASTQSWFLSTAFLGVQSYLSLGTRFVDSLGPDVDALVRRVKAANTKPLYKVTASYS